VEPGVAQHLVCGTAHALQQALAAGVPATRVHRVSGMILRPAFHAAAQALHTPAFDRRAARLRAGLPADGATGLVMFGGTGSQVMKRITQRLPDTPLVLMCGRNAALARALREQPARAPRVVLEFTPDVAPWMALADFFIGKPGPGSLSEAVHMGLPVIVTRNAWTMPQERWNTEWVRSQGLGVVLRRFDEVAQGVGTVLGDLPGYRRRVQAVHNRAVFEVPGVLQRVLEQAGPVATPSHGLGIDQSRAQPAASPA
jgi:UDP-N-acetylglucosamine:LPS N-acetylglucosamine transferase